MIKLQEVIVLNKTCRESLCKYYTNIFLNMFLVFEFIPEGLGVFQLRWNLFADSE
jgi:hypothetical protein